MKILRIFFYLFLGCLFTGEIFRVQIGDVAVTLRDISLVLLLIAWIIILLTRQILFPKHLQYQSIVVFVIICLLSLLWNVHHLVKNQFFVALLYLIRWGAYACLYPVVMSIQADGKRHIQNWLAIAGSSVAVLGFIQLVFYPSLRNLYYLGWDEHIYRLFSVFLDPNFAGTFFALFDLFILYRLIKRWKFGIQRYWHIAALALSTLSLIFTFSRSGMILFVVGMVLYLALYKKLQYVLILIVGLVLVYILESSHFHIENINLFRGTSSEARIQTAETALNIFGKNPIIGVGFDAYRYAQIRYGYRQDAIASHADAGTDNSFLFVLATTGIIGFLSYMWMWKALLAPYLASPGKRSEGLLRSHEGKVLFVSVVGLFVSALFINALFYPFLMSYMWILLGVMDAEKS